MSKRKKTVVGTFAASAALLAILTAQASEHLSLANTLSESEYNSKGEIVPEEEVKAVEEEAGSIQLSPGLYVPSETLFLNQQVDREDVVKTMNLEEIKLSTHSALAELDAGIAVHLGFSEDQLSPVQVQLYNENVAHYSKLVEAAGQDALEEQDVNAALQEFKDWASAYKAAIVDSIKEEEQKKKEEELKKIEEVVGVDDSPNSDDLILDKVSYGIPNLGDQYLTYEPYTAITAKTTPHYRLQTLAKTDEHGYRIYDGAVAVALGSAYGVTIGTLYDITFEDGKVMRAVLGDNKSDKHTDALHQYRDATGAYNGKSGNIVEIIFDTTNYENMQAVNRKINGDYPTKVISIEKVGMAEGFGQ